MKIPGDLTGPEQRVLVEIIRTLDKGLKVDPKRLPDRHRPDDIDAYVSLSRKIRNAMHLSF